MSDSVEFDGDQQVLAALKVLSWVREQRSQLNDMEADARAVVEESMGSAEVATVGGQVVATWKSGQTTRVDIALLRERFPEIAEICTVTKTTRPFRPQEPK